jgi:hypothetical protein
MKTKYLLLVPLLALTACTTYRDPVHNPQGLSDRELIREQVAKIEAMDREMERRTTAMKLEHMKELQQVQIKAASQPTGHANCKLLCF